jgi:hypothetical protein
MQEATFVESVITCCIRSWRHVGIISSFLDSLEERYSSVDFAPGSTGKEALALLLSA